MSLETTENGGDRIGLLSRTKERERGEVDLGEGSLRMIGTKATVVVVLGNTIISKNCLRTHKIMVMHSNERGEYPRTLVDRKRKRYENTVDVVLRLHDMTDLSTERTTPPRSAHVQLGDVPRTLDTVEAEGEFRQHDGVVTVMTLLPTQGFA